MTNLLLLFSARPLSSLPQLVNSQPVVAPVQSDTAFDLPEHLQVLYLSTIEEGDITEQHIPAFKQLLREHEAIFAKSSTDLGYSSVLEHDIDTGSAKPI